MMILRILIPMLLLGVLVASRGSPQTPLKSGLPFLSLQEPDTAWSLEEAIVPPDFAIDQQPDLRVDAAGRPWVIWARRGLSGIRSLSWTRWEGDQWLGFQAIDPLDPSDVFKPRFVFDESDTLWLVWNRATGDEIWFTRGYDGVWSESMRVHPPDTLTYSSPSIDIGGGEVWVAWWAERGTGSYDVFVTHWLGDSWEPPTNLTAGISGKHWFCDIAVDPSGVPHVVWTDVFTNRLLYSTEPPGGAWCAPVTLHNPSEIIASNDVQIVAALDGLLHVVWTGRAYVGGVLVNNDIYYSRKDVSGWSDPVLISEDTARLDLFPELRVRNARDIWITWSSYRRTLSDSARVLVTRFDGDTTTPPHRLDSGQFKWNATSRIDLDASGRPWVAWNAIHGNFGGDAILYSRYTGDVPVPVLLSDLQVNAFRDGVELRWQATHDAFVAFRIERAVDGFFRNVGRVSLGNDPLYVWQEQGLPPGRYSYRIAGILRTGDPVYLGPVEVVLGSAPGRLTLDVVRSATSSLPAEIAVGLSEGGNLSLKTLDLQGRLVSTVASGFYPAGWHTFHWSPRSNSGRMVASGIYFLVAREGNEVATKRITVFK